jgi:SAM-dependent methyltransferase
MTATGTTTEGTATHRLDEARAAAFAERLLGHYTSGFVTYMVDLGHRLGLFGAARAGLHERYVREWLGAVAAAGIVDYDAATGTYTLPPEHAACLSGDGELNVAPLSRICGLLARYIDPVAGAFRHGGGVPYAAYRPEFTDVMDGLNRPTFDAALVDGIVPLAAGLADRLAAGTRVADIGCGTGHSTNVLARAFPRSSFTGYDLAEDAIERARREAAAGGLSNARFEVSDVARMPTEPPLGAVFAFDAIHDQVDPAGVLRRVRDALSPGGVFVMVDIRASSYLENNLANPLAPMLYGLSTLHCMPVSLAGGGAGLGTVWGEERAREMLAAAGFVDLDVHEVPGDPIDSVYVARTPE